MDDLDSKIIQSVIKKNKLSELIETKCFSSGSINRVYNLGGKYALKVEGKGEHEILKPAQEITAKLLAKGAKVPKIIDFGAFEDNRYILMEMVAGNNLVYDWMSFNDSQKEGFIEQLAEQLQLWHSIPCHNYSMPIVSYNSFDNLKPAIERLTDKEINIIQKDKLPKEIADKIDMLVQFYHDNISSLDETGTAVMVHQDIHLENIFHQDGQLTGIIDLDWACQAPKDYELWKIMDTFHRPKFTVEEKVEHLYGDYQMTKELGWLKKYYPALFKVSNLSNRVRLYYLDPFFETLIDYQNGLWKGRGIQKAVDKIKDFYQNSWLDEVLKI